MHREKHPSGETLQIDAIISAAVWQLLRQEFNNINAFMYTVNGRGASVSASKQVCYVCGAQTAVAVAPGETSIKTIKQ